MVRPAEFEFRKFMPYHYFHISILIGYKLVQFDRRLMNTIQSLRTLMKDNSFTEYEMTLVSAFIARITIPASTPRSVKSKRC